MAGPGVKPKIYPLAWLALAIISMLVLDFGWPVAQLVDTPYHWAGLVPAALGLAMVLYSGSSFLKAKTGMLPFSEATELVTSGFYRITRNPMYLGMLLFLLGLAVWLGSVGALIPAPLFAWIIDRRFIRNEEKFLLRAFGDDYRRYMQRVRRWI